MRKDSAVILGRLIPACVLETNDLESCPNR